jgi:hypothetical protein
MRFGDIDPSSLAQRFEQAGMIHEDVDQRLAIDGYRPAGAARAIVSLVQGLELDHGGVQLEDRATAHGAVLRSAAGMVRTPGMFQISAAIPARPPDPSRRKAPSSWLGGAAPSIAVEDRISW